MGKSYTFLVGLFKIILNCYFENEALVGESAAGRILEGLINSDSSFSCFL